MSEFLWKSYLKEIYYSPKGFTSAPKLIDTIKREKKISLPVKFAKEWIQKQAIDQLTRTKHRIDTGLHYRGVTPNHEHQSDILFVDKAPNGFKYILGVSMRLQDFLFV